MATADSNRILLAYAKETGYAEDPPNPAPTLQNVRFTSESLGQDTETVTSQEIRADRQIADIIRTNISSSGDTNHELSYGTYDTWLESALMSDSGFSTAATLLSAGSATFTATGSTIAGTGIHTSAVVGSWIFVEDATNAANNGYFKITATATDTLTVARGDAAIVDEGPTAGVTVTQLSEITNGTTLDTYVIEKHYQDLTTTFAYFLGQAIEGMSLSIGVGAVLTAGFNWIGAKEKSATATIGTGTNTAVTTNPIMNAVDNVVKILEGSGATADFCAQNLTLQLNNNLRAKNKVGTLGAFGVGKSSVSVTGTVQAFFNDAAVMNAYLNFTNLHLATRFADSDGDVYILDIPSIKYTAGRRVAGGINQDIIADLSWTAKRDTTEDVTIRIVRRPAP